MSELPVLSSIRYIPHKPSPKQALFLSLRCREALYGGSAGCGKSDALLMGAAQGINIKTYSAILFRRTYADLKLSGALMDRARSWWSATPARWNDNEKTFTFPSGSRIGFGYLDSEKDLQRYQSADFQYIGFDEQSQFTGAQVTYMFSRLRRTTDFPASFPLRLRGASNPGGIGHKFLVGRYGIPTDRAIAPGSQPIVTRYPDGRVQRVFVPAHAADNPGLDWADYELSLAELTEIRRKQLRDGLWIQESTGLVYHAAANADFVDRLPDGQQWTYVLGVDIGATNNCAFAIYALSPWLPEIYLLATMEPEGLNTPRDVAQYVKRLDETYHFERIVGDHGGLGKGYLEEMRRWFEIPIINAEKNDKRGYIELYNGALENRMVRVVRPACATWIDQTSHLLWKDERRLEEMPKMPNHSCDAALYGWRESRHYTHEDKPEDQGRDLMEEAELQRAYSLEDEFNELGCVLPDYLR
jgi:hypothetical protein